MTARVLIVDDDDSIRWVLEKALEPLGAPVVSVGTIAAARELIDAEAFALVLLDVRLPDGDGLALLARSRASRPEVPVVVLTAQDTMGAALEAMKGGAYDFLPKPFDVSRVRSLAAEVLRASRPDGGSAPDAFVGVAGLVGTSAGMLELVKAIGRVAPTNATVLITGESGTGKELVARAIHAHSARARSGFVTVNMAAIPASLLESELYGHERGAFTGAGDRRVGKFELASGGTLLLDEIGDMPAEQQAKLLRALQEKRIERVGGEGTVPVDVRVIAASNVDLARAAEQGLFRKDLYYRLNVLPLHLAPLREHAEDIPLLVEHFLAKHQADRPGRRVTFDARAMHALCAAVWPGNVRELENAVRRCVVLSRSPEIGAAELAELVPTLAPGAAPSPPAAASPEDALRSAVRQLVDAASPGDRLHARLLELVEQEAITRALDRTDGNQLRAASLLGLNRNTLSRKLPR